MLQTPHDILTESIYQLTFQFDWCLVLGDILLTPEGDIFQASQLWIVLSCYQQSLCRSLHMLIMGKKAAMEEGH